MKLLRLKLLSKFRGLNKGFEIVFNNSITQEQKLEPICFIGLNGSGKSNILEVISEIFYYLENFVKDIRIDNNFEFEISYILSKQVYQLNSSKSIESDFLEITIVKNREKNPIIILNGKRSKEDIKNILPTQIIGYSSGMNELISNPYIKMDFQYLKEFKDMVKEENIGNNLSLNRMFFMDYDLNKLITICNFLFDEQIDNSNLGIKNLSPLKDEIEINSLHSFSISLKLREEDKKPIKLPSKLNLTIEKLKQCATLDYIKNYNSSKGEYKEYMFSFWVNSETKKAFKMNFGNAFELFKELYFLRLLNNYLISTNTQNQIKNANIKTNISALLPKYEEDKKIFNISDISFRKKRIREPIYYNQLSDGEHQFLHVIGMMLLVEKEGTLFLLDEPETHFNPDWRSKFVSILNECVKNESGIREQEVVLTTHSPFIVSDCKQEKVFIFNKENGFVKEAKNPEFQTYGTSIEMIYWNIFGKHETIAKLALNELKEIEEKVRDNKLTKEEAMRELSKYGDSFEKMNIVRLLREKYS